jgi:UDP-N-acetylmuramyl pentapeptide phosphotransferase/UDP-N-acetylglucosamine-1-phosphate transferase
MLRHLIRRNRWATLSTLITVLDAVLIYSLIGYLDSHGLWRSSPPGRMQSVVSVWGGLSVLASLATALLAVAKDESKAFAAVAVCLSVVSFLFYVQ